MLKFILPAIVSATVALAATPASANVKWVNGEIGFIVEAPTAVRTAPLSQLERTPVQVGDKTADGLYVYQGSEVGFVATPDAPRSSERVVLPSATERARLNATLIN